MRFGGSKLKKQGKMQFLWYFLLSPNIKGCQLKIRLEVVTKNLRSFTNYIRSKSDM